ncbi:MAG: nucleoside phosphorylase [Spirochaetales bacterium]|nr:nucleoside phosphorylase [Spirochaetales bacterium]
MAVPFHSEKLTCREITGPDRWAEYMKSQGRFARLTLPDLIIFTWQKTFFSWIKSRYAHRALKEFPGEVILLNGRLSHEGYGEDSPPAVGVAFGFGIGAPAAVFMMEALGALGSNRFLGLGTAGGLGGSGTDLKVGDVVLANKAFRDEGTSYHYLADDKEAQPDPGEAARLEELLKRGGYRHHRGPVWTTDAFFRETREEVLFYREKGALAVDMEASALYACAECRDLSMASLFVISDILMQEGWSPDFHHPDIGKILKSLFTDVTGFA